MLSQEQFQAQPKWEIPAYSICSSGSVPFQWIYPSNYLEYLIMKTCTTLSRLALMTLTVLVSTSISEAGQVVVFGDSWAVPFAPALQQVLDGNGYSGINVANAAFGGETASNMASGSLTRGLPYITATLNANPDAQAVHLSIGGNDFLGGWLPSFTPAQDASLFDAIYLDIFTIVNHILSIRPDVEIYHPTYDYFPASTVAG